MVRPPYRIARQKHLGEMLDRLQDLGVLTWRFDFEVPPGRETTSAVYWVTASGQVERKFDTRRAEELVLRHCKQQGIPWLPVPYPGGEVQLAETRQRIEALKRGIQAPSTRGSAHVPKLGIEPFDLARHPALEQRLGDVPGDNRSAQVYSAACSCIEAGLTDNQAKWFLAQYPPFVDKFGNNAQADRELDRVIASAHGRA